MKIIVPSVNSTQGDVCIRPLHRKLLLRGTYGESFLLLSMAWRRHLTELTERIYGMFWWREGIRALYKVTSGFVHVNWELIKSFGVVVRVRLVCNVNMAIQVSLSDGCVSWKAMVGWLKLQPLVTGAAPYSHSERPCVPWVGARMQGQGLSLASGSQHSAHPVEHLSWKTSWSINVSRR